MWIVTEGEKHFLTWIGIQTLQNVHNTNIILSSQTAQIRHMRTSLFGGIWGSIFYMGKGNGGAKMLHPCIF